jgi:hypothetical protein
VLIVSDFANQFKKELATRRESCLQKLVSAPTDRMAGKIDGIDDALRMLETVKRDFLAKSDRDEDDAE